MKDAIELDIKTTGVCVGFVILCKILIDLTDAVNKSVIGNNKTVEASASTSRAIPAASAAAPTVVSPSDERPKRGENLYGKPPRVRYFFLNKFLLLLLPIRYFFLIICVRSALFFSIFGLSFRSLFSISLAYT